MSRPRTVAAAIIDSVRPVALSCEEVSIRSVNEGGRRTNLGVLFVPTTNGVGLEGMVVEAGGLEPEPEINVSLEE